MPRLPTGTVTFLFTDIQGSTPLWERDPESMKAAVARHHAILHQVATQNAGQVFKIIGDAFQIAFKFPLQAVQAAITAQRLLHEEPWGETGPLRVRMGIHSGPAELVNGVLDTRDYAVSHTLNRAARIMSAGAGGQTLLSLVVAELLRGHLPKGVSLKDLGEHHLKGLLHAEHIFQLVAPGLTSEFPSLNSESRPNHNLPLTLTSFVGREGELSAAQELLAGSHLLTLTGPGGIGKTRLALQLAQRALPAFSDGVWLVELATLSDPALVEAALATALRLRENPNQPLSDTLMEALCDKHLLLVIDNCEHLVEPVARLVEMLMSHSPNLKILATSRETLGVPGETIFRVPSLALIDPGCPVPIEELAEVEAVRLFSERACSVLPSFALTERNASLVTQICTRLDGIPLAIELAAARTAVLQVEQIAERLDDRFRLLTGGSRTALPRQQTLRAAMDWSWSLLNSSEQALLRRLSVFSDGWTLEAAEGICCDDSVQMGDVLDLLGSLVNKSLVRVDRKPGAPARYKMLETIAQYARDQLLNAGEADRVRTRHVAFYADYAAQLSAQLRGAGQAEALQKLESDHGNLRLALEWALDHQPETALQLAGDLSHFWDTHGHLRQARRWLEAALECCPELSPARVRAISGLGMISSRLSDVSTSIRILEEAMSLARQLGDPRLIAEAAQALSSGWTPGQSMDLFEESLQIWRQLGDSWGIATTLGAIAGPARDLDCDYARARALYQESLDLFRQIGDQREVAGALYNLCLVALAQADEDQAENLARESLALYRQLEDQHGVATMLRCLGQAAFYRGDLIGAEGLLQEGVAIFDRLGDQGCGALTTSILVCVTARQGRSQESAALVDKNLVVIRDMGLPFLVMEGLIGALHAALEAGQTERAGQFLAEALALPPAERSPAQHASLLECAAHLKAAAGEARIAALLLGRAQAIRREIDAPLPGARKAKIEELVSRLTGELGQGEVSTALVEGADLAMNDYSSLFVESISPINTG